MTSQRRVRKCNKPWIVWRQLELSHMCDKLLHIDQRLRDKIDGTHLKNLPSPNSELPHLYNEIARLKSNQQFLLRDNALLKDMCNDWPKEEKENSDSTDVKLKILQFLGSHEGSNNDVDYDGCHVDLIFEFVKNEEREHIRFVVCYAHSLFAMHTVRIFK